MKTYVVGNWKMHFDINQSSVYLHKICRRLTARRGVAVAVAPSFMALQPLALQMARHQHQGIYLCAQNVATKDEGAYTGEVSAQQLRGVVQYCIVGHSERRHIFGETNKDVRAKVAQCRKNRITPILCVGETAGERDFGETRDVLRDQVLSGVSEVAKDEIDKIIIAYEPVWAISSTGEAQLASPDEVAKNVRFIRDLLEQTYGEEAKSTPILYGGSVNATNAGGYLTVPGVNGLLIGGASLILDEFCDIVEVAKRVSK